MPQLGVTVSPTPEPHALTNVAHQVTQEVSSARHETAEGEIPPSTPNTSKQPLNLEWKARHRSEGEHVVPPHTTLTREGQTTLTREEQTAPTKEGQTTPTRKEQTAPTKEGQTTPTREGADHTHKGGER